MVKMIVFIGFLMLGHICKAQQKELDSLLLRLKNYAIDDTTKLNLLLDISFDYATIDPVKGIETADAVITLAGKLNSATFIAKGYSQKGMNYLYLGEESLALKMYEKSLQLFQQLKDTKGTAISLYRLGELYFRRGEYFTAQQYLQKSIPLFEKADKEKLPNVLNARGAIYQSLGQYREALREYTEALRISKKLGDAELTATVLGNIAGVQKDLNENAEGIKTHKEALALYHQLGNKNGIALELDGIGSCFDNMENTDSAFAYYTEAVKINEAIGNKDALADNFTNIGSMFNSVHNYDKALEYFSKSILMYQKLGDKPNLATVLNLMADAYVNAPLETLLKYGITSKQRFAKAMAYNAEALLLANETGSLKIKRWILESLGPLYEKQNNFVAATEIYKQLIPLKDSLVNDSTKQAVTQQRLQYEFSKKEDAAKAENDEKHAVAYAENLRQKRENKILILGGAVIVAAATISFVFYKKRHAAEVQKTKAEFNVQVSKTEMKALLSQMNPHFIFNSLQSINKYIVENDKENASEYLYKFSQLMRLILENSRQQEVPLKEDLSALELYMQLELLRFGNRFRYLINVDPQIDQEDTLIPPMLLQPFVENSIIHGLAAKQDGLIQIFIKRDGSMLRCTLQDNGVGRQSSLTIQKAEKGKNYKSLGMKIIQERLDIMNRLKKVSAAVHFFDLKDSDDKPSGLHIELLLPFKSAF